MGLSRITRALACGDDGRQHATCEAPQPMGSWRVAGDSPGHHSWTAELRAGLGVPTQQRRVAVQRRHVLDELA